MATPNVTIGGKTFAADVATIEGESVIVVRDKMGFGADGEFNDVHSGNPFPTREGGTYGYRAGTAASTVDVPATAHLRRVSVVAGASSVTVTIGGGDTITIRAGGAFDEQIPGEALGADVVIAGGVDIFYVSWVDLAAGD